MVVCMANEMSNRGDDFDWTPQVVNNKFGAPKQKSSDDGDYDWFTEGQSDFSDFDLPRHYNEPTSKTGQQLQTLFPSTDEFCSDVESDCESTSERRSSRNKGPKSVSERTKEPKSENSAKKKGEADETTTIGSKDLRRRRRRDARASAVVDAAWGVSSSAKEPDFLASASHDKRGSEEYRSRNRSETKALHTQDFKSSLSPVNASKANKPSKSSSNDDLTSTAGQKTVLRRTVSVPLKDNEKTGRERSNSRHGRQSLQDTQKPERERSNSRQGRQSTQDSQKPERERSSSQHGRQSIQDAQKPERGRSNSRHGRSCLEDTHKPERDRSSSHHGRSSRRPSMRSIAPSERSKSPKNAIMDRIKTLESNSNNLPDIVRRASSSRSLMASDAETAKRRDRNRERRRSMSGSRRTESMTSSSLLGEDCTEAAEDKHEDEMDLSSHRRQRGRPSKFEMVRADSIKNIKAPLISSSLALGTLQPVMKQSSNSCLLTLPDVPDLDDICTPVPQGRKSSIVRNVNVDEAEKSRDTSRSRRDEATANNCTADRTRQRDGSRTRRGSAVDATSDDNIQIANNRTDRGRCGGGYLPMTLGSSRRSEGESSDNIRNASLRDVLSSADKGPSMPLSSASVPDRINKKKASGQSCSVSLPGDVLKKSVEVRSGSRRRGGKEP